MEQIDVQPVGEVRPYRTPFATRAPFYWTPFATEAPFYWRPFPNAIRNQIPEEGIWTKDLLACFKGQVVGEERKTGFLKILREVTWFDREKRILFLRSSLHEGTSSLPL